MSITINVNGLTLCHRGSGGVSRNTLPDVCKTPPYAIPRPFSNTAYSRDLARGTTTVFADGGNMIANYGSIFARSTGDEGGSMGGVKSGTFMAEADFITHSFDVFFEGKPACRLTDKMFMNHRNTVNMAGLSQAELKALQNAIQKMVCECNDEVKPSEEDTCMSLGNKKHDCVDAKKDAENKKRRANGEPESHGGEKGYKVDDKGNVVRENGKPKVDDISARRAAKADNVGRLRGTLDKANAALGAAKAKISGAGGATAGKANAPKFRVRGMGGFGSAVGEALAESLAMAALEETFKRAADAAAAEAAKAAQDLAKAEAEKIMRREGFKYPDGSVLDGNGKIAEISEYKFPCPKGVPTGGKNKQGVPSVSRGNGQGDWTRGQKEGYGKILESLVAGGEATPDAKLTKYNTKGC